MTFLVPPAGDIHVRFESRFGWTVRRAGFANPLSMHGTQSNVERSGRSLAQRERACLYVHSAAGAVIRTDSYAVPT